LLFGNPDPNFIIANLIVLLVAMTLHEFAHNYVGHLMGDPVPKQQGRLTLNPFVHINWLGWLMFAVIGFGILGSAPISPTRMRNPRWGYFYAVAAGPFSNLALAVLFGLIIRILGVETLLALPALVFWILWGMVFWNVLLFVFNLLPFFPLDGWHMLLSILPGDGLQRHQVPVFVQENVRPLSRFLQEPAFQWQRWQQLSYYVFLALIFISIAGSIVRLPFDPLGTLISQPTFSLTSMLIGG